MSSGTFSGDFNKPFFDPVNFSTARDTTVTTAFWFDGDENNTDSVNGTANFLKAGNNGLLVSDNTFYQYSGNIFNDATEWTASVVPAVPLPAGLPLMVLTLGGLGVVAARRKTT